MFDTDNLTKKEKEVLSFFDKDIVKLFDIENLTDIFYNCDGSIFIKVQGQEKFFKNHVGSLRVLINEIAYLNEVVINQRNPVLECSFAGMRITAVVPAIVSSPSLTIRKPNQKIITLDKYIKDKILSSHHRDILLNNFIKNPKNIMICGATGSGKTTFSNALLDRLTQENNNERIVSIQDTPELVIKSQNVLELYATQHFSIADCLKVTLRQSPKRIMVGEVRDKAIIALLDAFNTGHHGGLATIHANSAEDAIQRMISLGSQDYDLFELYNLIAITIGLVVSIQEVSPGVRKITEIIAIEGYDSQTKKIITKKL